jgi:hypothetical protein
MRGTFFILSTKEFPMTDILLDSGDGSYITLDGRVVKAKASDLMLDYAPSHKPDRPGPRRALVHDQRDGLTINYNNDYPGGVVINDVVAIKNRFSGIVLQGVRQISGLTAAAATGANPGSGTAAKTSLTLIGHVVVETNPDDPSPLRASLQQTIGQLQVQIETLSKRVRELEGGKLNNNIKADGPSAQPAVIKSRKR